MSKFIPVLSLLTDYFKLSSKQYPTSEKDNKEIKKIPYASAIDSLMYIIVCIRLDVAHAVVVVNRFFSNLGKKYSTDVKSILRYFIGTFIVCLCFSNDKFILDGYTDINIANNIDFRKSTLGYLK